MNCYRKVIQFNPPDCFGFAFFENGADPSMPLISTLEAYRLLNDGCKGYLAFVIDRSKEEAQLERILII